eukprot:sb/3465289/
MSWQRLNYFPPSLKGETSGEGPATFYYGGKKQQSSGGGLHIAFYYKYDQAFALDNLRCPAGARSLDDCRSNPIGSHDCSYFEGVVLKCRTEARGVDLDDFDVQMQKGSGMLSSNGTVVLNGTMNGLVCAEGINQRSAELLCNEAGYDYLVGYNTTKDIASSNKLDCDTMRGRNMSVIAENISCPSNATDIGDCSASTANGTCDADTALWLSCTNNDADQWELANITLAYNEAGHHERSDLRTGNDYGTVLVTVRNTRTGEERTGFTPYTSSGYTRSSICYMLGNTNSSPSYQRAGSISDRFNTKVSCGFNVENKLDFVLSYLWCPGYYKNLSSCNFNLAPEGYSYGSDNALWLNWKLSFKLLPLVTQTPGVIPTYMCGDRTRWLCRQAISLSIILEWVMKFTQS